MFLIDHIFVESLVVSFLQQTVCIPMGATCAPLLADLFLHHYEADFLQNLINSGKKYVAQNFNFTYRYIDDVLSLNNHTFGANIIYPGELEIKDTIDYNVLLCIQTLNLNFDTQERLQVKLYDKRDNFNFPIVNFPFLCSNIPASPAYGVFVSQLIRYYAPSVIFTYISVPHQDCLILRLALIQN